VFQRADLSAETSAKEEAIGFMRLPLGCAELPLRLGKYTLRLAAICVVLTSGAAIPALAMEQPDHLALIQQLSREAVAEVLDELQFPPGTVVHLVPETPHEANWLMARILEKALLARGCEVVVPALAGGAGVQSVPRGTPQPVPAAGKPESAGEASLQTEAEEADADGSLFDDGEGEAAADGEQATDKESDEREEGEDAEDDESFTGEEESRQSDQEAPGQRRGGGPRARRAAEQSQDTDEAGSGTQLAPDTAALDIVLPAEGEVLVFRVIECGVSYPWTKRSWLVGPRQYGRVASVRLGASWLVQPGRRLKGIAGGERVYLDAFPGWARPVLEGHAYPFAIKQPRGTSLQKIVEPVVVVGIISGLIYLFYQNQK
jgi:hypothetical protein